MLLVLATGCARQRFGATAGPESSVQLAARGPMPLDAVWLMERGGTSPADTTVDFDARAGRTIVLRHPPPDNATFAVVTIPPDSSRRGELVVRLTPAPGRYGLSVTAEPALPAQTTLRFSYAAHFIAPQGTTTRYPTLTRLEQGLGVGRVLADGRFQFVRATRPAGDMLQVTLDAPGTYHLAAPR